jgi:hypothetical protein
LVIIGRGLPVGVEVADGQEAHVIRGLNVSEMREPSAKAVSLVASGIVEVAQAAQLGNPDARVLMEEIGKGELLGEAAISYQGIVTADISRFVLKFWEIPSRSDRRELYFTAPDTESLYSGRHSIVLWDKGAGTLAHSKSARICGLQASGKKRAGVAVTGNLYAAVYPGG